VSSGFDCKDPRRGERDQSAEDGPKAKPTGVRIGSKIKQVDDAITPETQQWAFEVHPEVCFWALNQQHSMLHNKKKESGRNERCKLLRTVFPRIQQHLLNRPPGVAKDDLLDAAAAAWTALRRHRSEPGWVCATECDDRGFEVTIYH
jgi:predicted RNase H-like nuclease